MPMIPAIIRDLSDQEAFELQISENLHRKDISPMEESDAFQQLVASGLKTPEMIADKMGTSVKYVYDRLLLQRVIPQVQDAIRSGRLNITHAKQFARLPLADQEKLWEYEVDGVEDQIDAADLRERIKNLFHLKLENAPFDTSSASLVKKAGACTKCDFRTGCRQVLFADFDQEDLCLKQECWDQKLEAHIEKLIKDFQKAGKKVFLLTSGWGAHEPYISGSDWIHLKTEEETDFVGIIRHRRNWDSVELGQVIYLEKDPTEQKAKQEKLDEDDDDNDSGSSNGDSVEPREVFCLEVSGALVDVFKNYSNVYDNLNPTKSLIQSICSRFSSLEEDTKDMVIEKLGLAKDFNSEGEFSYSATMSNYAESLADEPENIISLFHLIDTLEDLEQVRWGLDEEDIQTWTGKLSPVNIDFLAIAKAVEARTEKFIPETV